jgi:glyoxylase-like metal-dependent hydrolase (beta-lactamase superfamily II)
MELIVLEGNHQSLDGGSMFGHVPRALWEKWVPVENHLVRLCCRTLLIKTEAKNILFEAGIGAFFPPHLKERYQIEEEHLLIKELQHHGIAPEQIDAIILSHLHFDHAGGLLSAYEPDKEAQLVFPRAHYWISKKGLERALHPHIRDKASFIPQLPQLLLDTGRVHVVEGRGVFPFAPSISYRESQGHTPGLLVVKAGTYYLPSDLIPGAAWVHLPVTTAYDRYPELAVNEKQALLDEVIENQGTLFLTHDPKHAFCQVKAIEGRYTSIENFFQNWKSEKI